MSKQMQLIMENWRKLGKEEKGSPQKLQEFTIADAALSAIMGFSNAGGGVILVNNGLGTIDAEDGKQAIEMLQQADIDEDDRQEAITDILKIYDFAQNAIERPSKKTQRKWKKGDGGPDYVVAPENVWTQPSDYEYGGALSHNALRTAKADGGDAFKVAVQQVHEQVRGQRL